MSYKYTSNYQSNNNNNNINDLLQNSRVAGTYRDPTRVARDVEAVLSSRSTGLRASITTFIENTGRGQELLSLAGTIPIVYNTSTYNIPVEFYIMPAYPVRGPQCFVRPSSNMVIKERHKHVGTDGCIYMPYLSEWRMRSHCLTEMIVWMQSLFGQDPPVFARQSISLNDTMSTLANNNTTPMASSAVSVERNTPPPDYGAVLAEQQRNRTQWEEEQRRLAEERRIAEEERRRLEQERRRTAEKERTYQQTRAELTRKLQVHLQRSYEDARREMANEMRTQGQLEKGAREVGLQIRDLECMKERLQEGMDIIDLNTIKLKDYIQRAEEKGEVEADELAVPSDIHSRQMLNLSAKNAAYSDCIYHLQDACYNEALPIDTYLQKVRKLAREQFVCRYHLMKVAKASEAGLTAPKAEEY